jgi:hypothetical protein
MFDAFNQAKLMNAHQNMRNLKPQPEKDMSLDELKRLSGGGQITGETTAEIDTALQAKKAQYMRENNIRPGDPEWFHLWFSRPEITKANPFKPRN